MFLGRMRHEPIPRASTGVDWKALGYLVSILSVFLLGAIAWPNADDPAWHEPVLILGMAASILGMVFRYKAHLDQRKELKKTKARADRR
jgi:hypothetical protein